MRKPCFKMELRLLRIWPMSPGILTLMLKWLGTRFESGLHPILIPTITNGPFVSKENPEQVIGRYQHRWAGWERFFLWIGYILGKIIGGRGMMTEALKAVLDFVLPKRGISKVRLVTPVLTQLQAVRWKGWNVLSKNYCQWCGEKKTTLRTLFITR